MRILHLSDTHGLHSQIGRLPEADVIVHSGDFTHYGTEKECLDFLNWFIALPYKHKIFVVGNHDLCLYDADNIEDLPANVHFLQDRGVTVDGVRFYGTGFMHYRAIPPDTQVLVTHEPRSAFSTARRVSALASMAAPRFASRCWRCLPCVCTFSATRTTDMAFTKKMESPSATERLWPTT